MAKPFIAAYHAGATSVNNYITSDQLIYWYRPTLKSLDCDATDTTMVPANNASGNYFEGRPDGWEDMQDSVFVVAMLTSPGVVTVTSGGNTQSFNAPAGASAFQVAMQVGQQQFSLTRGGTTVLSGVSLKNISPICICGIYNFNAYVGTLPAGFSDPLGHDGLVSLTAGLHVSTCSATPSLGTAPSSPSTTVVPPPPTSTTSQTSTTSKPGSTTLPTSTSTSSSASSSPTGTCTSGTGPGNYVGLCSFSCNYGYCPSPCTCTSTGSPISPPPSNGGTGYPLPGEDSNYAGLCAFTCSHGYCPSTACTSSSPTTTTPSSPTTSTSGQVCIAGTGPGNYVGLCNFCCNYGYCPSGPCTCTASGAPVPTPPVTGTNGLPLAGEDSSYLGLCSFACNHGYCPPTACTSD